MQSRRLCFGHRRSENHTATDRKARETGNGAAGGRCWGYAPEPATGARDTWRIENRKFRSFVFAVNDHPPGDDKLLE